MSCAFADLDGAYVLGSLSPVERAEFERHLAGCEACARSVRELAGLPGLLAKVPVDVLERPAPAEPVPVTLLPALVTAAQRRQRRRTTWVAGLAAAAVAAVTVVSTALVTVALDDGPRSAGPSAVETTAPAQRLRSVGHSSATGWVSLTPVAWGTRLDLTCEYAAYEYGGLGATVYELLVRTTDGRSEEAATWRAVPGKEMHVTGATSAGPEEIASVVVRTSDGHAVLRLAP
jgi:hypothetical protein